jgi:hypothetical protein
VAGTLIQTRDGEKAIQDIQIGDWVLSDDPNTPGDIEYKQVVQTFVHETNYLVDVYIGGEKITTTEGHRFWVKDVGWVAAKDLGAGAQLETKSESWLGIERVEKHTEVARVYNFEVQGFHTYFVSALGLLVHNGCPPGGTGANYDKVNGQGIYVLKDENDVVKYVGRGDVPTRLNVHANTPSKAALDSQTIFDNNLTKAQAKGLEQRLIDHFGGAPLDNPSTTLLNDIRSFRPQNPNAQAYRDAATDQLFNEALRRISSQ